jgi:trans-aconitate methyltransferase
MAEELIQKLRLAGSERVLDIGCGDGRMTAAISRRLEGGAVVGIDSSAEMIRHAASQYSGTRYPNLSFERRDARELPYTGSFDRVFSNAALHWIPEQAAVLSGIYRALVPGGRLLVQMGGQGNAREVLAVLDTMLKEARWKRYFSGFSFAFNFFSDDQYRALLDSAGFEVIRVTLIPRDMVHRTRGEMAGWIRTTWLPWVERVPPRDLEAFISEIIDRYAEGHPPDAQDSFHIGMVRLEAEAVRPEDPKARLRKPSPPFANL